VVARTSQLLIRVSSVSRLKNPREGFKLGGRESEETFIKGGWEGAAKAACFQVLTIQGVVAGLLKSVEPC
jgi:hypothetical protein